ncbi:hypothetical protein RSOLAG1IB_07308 [Rhizoctonia solani AG-1 IB]|uniref:Uncharacterized protein n=1 Tax=Thanatephorus cucumeris (strain AG1-IB / isolate 7/3/14) TaxID=1108050 RepID=A0A0B7FCY5_THACB|nr:hypothetical protein RSOLAG1IB_07308 [Rhizoctonia solani AG-1 IB]
MATAVEQLAQLEKQGLTPAEKAKAQAAVIDELKKKTTTKELLDEIMQLSAFSIAIDQDFDKVHRAFGEVDNSGFKFPRKLQPEWKVLKDKWTRLLWDSRTTATRLEVQLDDFHQVVLKQVDDYLAANYSGPMAGIRLAAVKANLKSFVGRNPLKEATIKEGEEHSSAFLELKRDLEHFKTTFDDFTKGPRAEIEAQIASVKGQINSIVIEIQKCDDTIRRLGLLLGVTIVGTAVAAGFSLLAFGILGPCIAIKVLIAGAIAVIAEKIALINTIKRKQDLQAQLRAKEAELRALEGKLESLKKIEALLQVQKTSISDIAYRIASFAHIWSVMVSDAKKIDTLLDNLSDSNDRATLQQRLDLMRTTYQPLKQGLALYATQVDRSGVAKP